MEVAPHTPPRRRNVGSSQSSPLRKKKVSSRERRRSGGSPHPSPNRNCKPSDQRRSRPKWPKDVFPDTSTYDRSWLPENWDVAMRPSKYKNSRDGFRMVRIYIDPQGRMFFKRKAVARILAGGGADAANDVGAIEEADVSGASESEQMVKPTTCKNRVAQRTAQEVPPEKRLRSKQSVVAKVPAEQANELEGWRNQEAPEISPPPDKRRCAKRASISKVTPEIPVPSKALEVSETSEEQIPNMSPSTGEKAFSEGLSFFETPRIVPPEAWKMTRPERNKRRRSSGAAARAKGLFENLAQATPSRATRIFNESPSFSIVASPIGLPGNAEAFASRWSSPTRKARRFGAESTTPAEGLDLTTRCRQRMAAKALSRFLLERGRSAPTSCLEEFFEQRPLHQSAIPKDASSLREFCEQNNTFLSFQSTPDGDFVTASTISATEPAGSPRGDLSSAFDDTDDSRSDNSAKAKVTLIVPVGSQLFLPSEPTLTLPPIPEFDPKPALPSAVDENVEVASHRTMTDAGSAIEAVSELAGAVATENGTEPECISGRVDNDAIRATNAVLEPANEIAAQHVAESEDISGRIEAVAVPNGVSGKIEAVAVPACTSATEPAMEYAAESEVDAGRIEKIANLATKAASEPAGDIASEQAVDHPAASAAPVSPPAEITLGKVDELAGAVAADNGTEPERISGRVDNDAIPATNAVPEPANEIAAQHVAEPEDISGRIEAAAVPNDISGKIEAVAVPARRSATEPAMEYAAESEVDADRIEKIANLATDSASESACDAASEQAVDHPADNAAHDNPPAEIVLEKAEDILTTAPATSEPQPITAPTISAESEWEEVMLTPPSPEYVTARPPSPEYVVDQAMKLAQACPQISEEKFFDVVSEPFDDAAEVAQLEPDAKESSSEKNIPAEKGILEPDTGADSSKEPSLVASEIDMEISEVKEGADRRADFASVPTPESTLVKEESPCPEAPKKKGEYNTIVVKVVPAPTRQSMVAKDDGPCPEAVECNSGESCSVAADVVPPPIPETTVTKDDVPCPKTVGDDSGEISVSADFVPAPMSPDRDLIEDVGATSTASPAPAPPRKRGSGSGLSLKFKEQMAAKALARFVAERGARLPVAETLEEFYRERPVYEGILGDVGEIDPVREFCARHPELLECKGDDDDISEFVLIAVGGARVPQTDPSQDVRADDLGPFDSHAVSSSCLASPCAFLATLEAANVTIQDHPKESPRKTVEKTVEVLVPRTLECECPSLRRNGGRPPALRRGPRNPDRDRRVKFDCSEAEATRLKMHQERLDAVEAESRLAERRLTELRRRGESLRQKIHFIVSRRQVDEAFNPSD